MEQGHVDSGAKIGEFDPVKAQRELRHAPSWMDFKGNCVRPPGCVGPASAEQVARGESDADIGSLPFRNPNEFVAGGIHEHLQEWDKILPDNDEGNMIRGWVKEGIDAEEFFVEFKGKFKGQDFDSPKPPSFFQTNAPVCDKFVEFVSSTLEEWVRCGAIVLLGKVGEVAPPLVVMPLTVEPTKPRLCHDSRFLNLWVKDLPFSLDTLKDVPRLVRKGSFMSSLDHKGAYQHILLKEGCRRYFGIEWKGFYFVYATLPFGFKASCYIYHKMSQMVASYGRDLGVPCLVYIDDSLNEELCGKGASAANSGERYHRAEQAVYVMCQLWTRLGYTLSLNKSVLIPTQVLRFLGMLADSVRMAFLLPEDKKAAFAVLREKILENKLVGIKTLQRLQGKCISFSLAVPAARLYISEMSKAVGKLSRSSKMVYLSEVLRAEIEHWRFIDHWAGCCPWREERHLQLLSLATDASTYKWGAVVGIGDGKQGIEMADYWESGDDRPIHLKEADALLVTLRSVAEQIVDHRVDAFVDNMAVVFAWERRACHDLVLARKVKEIFELVTELNVDLHLEHVRSEENPADAPSRSLGWGDARLGVEAWESVERKFGPHSVDLMATDTNAMRRDGLPIRHFTPCPMPGTAGVNLFAQDLAKESGQLCCYPPFAMIAPVLKFFEECEVRHCTIVVPDMRPRPAWWPALQGRIRDTIVLGRKGQVGVLFVPSKKGYIKDDFGLKWDLLGLDCSFERDSS